MNLGEIRAKIASRVDDTPDTTFLNDAINSIQFRVLNEKVNWTFLQASTTFQTTQGDNTYTKSTIAADMDLIYDVYCDDNKLTPISSVRSFDQIFPNPTATGTPTHYMEWGGELKLYPIPDSAITMNVKYFKKVTTPMEDDADEPVIPVEFQEILVLGGMMLFYEQDEDFDRFDRKTTEFEVFLKRMKASNEAEEDKFYSLSPKRQSSGFQPFDYQSSRR